MAEERLQTPLFISVDTPPNVEINQNLDILSSIQFKNGSGAVILGKEHDRQPMCLITLKPGEVLIKISLQEDFWGELSPTLIGRGNSYWIIANPNQPFSTRIIREPDTGIITNHLTNPNFKNERLEGSREEYKGKPADTEEIIQQKNNVRDRLEQMVTRAFQEGETFHIIGRVYLIPITDEMRDASVIAGDPNSPNKTLQKTTRLLDENDHFLIIELDENGKIKRYLPPNFGKPSFLTTNLREFPVSDSTRVGDFIGSGEVANRRARIIVDNLIKGATITFPDQPLSSSSTTHNKECQSPKLTPAQKRALVKMGHQLIGDEETVKLFFDLYKDVSSIFSREPIEWEDLLTKLQIPSNSELANKIRTYIRQYNNQKRGATREETIKRVVRALLENRLVQLGLENIRDSDTLELLTDDEKPEEEDFFEYLFKTASLEKESRGLALIFLRLARRLPEYSDYIIKTSLRNIDKLKTPEDDEFILQIELCPLYVNIGGQTVSQHGEIIPKATNEEDILSSMVGGKWEATKAVIKALSEELSRAGLKLRVKAFFGNMGVILTDQAFVNREALDSQKELYDRLLRLFCDECGASLDFYTFDEIPTLRKVLPQFLVSRNERIPLPETLEEYIKLAFEDVVSQDILERLINVICCLPKNERNELHQLLADRLRLCEGKPDIYQVLVLTYTLGLSYATQHARIPHMNLGMEISTNLMCLRTMIGDVIEASDLSDLLGFQARLPALNVFIKPPK